jgi:hypothetical protein
MFGKLSFRSEMPCNVFKTFEFGPNAVESILRRSSPG